MFAITTDAEVLSPLALGDVDHHDAQAHELGVHPDRVTVDEPIADLSLGSGGASLELEVARGLAALKDASVHRLDLVPERWNQILRGAADVR